MEEIVSLFVKTDGEELCHNSGGILFENFYLG